MNIKFPSFFISKKRGSILIVATVTVLLMLAISGSLILQTQADVRYTQFVKHRDIVTAVAQGAIHESLNALNLNPEATQPNGNIGVTTWNPQTDDVGMDGIANTGDEGERDAYPTFARPGLGLPGEPGGAWRQVLVTDDGQQILQAFYAVYDEDLGSNNVDDNHNDPGDGSLTDDLVEAAYRKLKAVSWYAGQYKKIEVMVGNSEEFYIFEAFFKAIYAGNSSNESGYYLDIGGPVQGNPDDIEGDIYVNGLIRLHNSSLVWKRESFDDLNGNGIFDLGEPVSDVAGQEIDVYNLGTEATEDVRLRNTISETEWERGRINLGGRPNVFTGDADSIGGPDFQGSLDQVTIRVADEINANGVSYGLTQGSDTVQSRAIEDPSNPAHLFVKANSDQLSKILNYYGEGGVNPYLSNGLDNYILKDITSNSASLLNISPGGNHQVYLIEGNLIIGSDGVENLTFNLPDQTDPIRTTFLVKGNVIFTDNLVYRDSAGISFTNENWNPYDDAISIVALKDETQPNPDSRGNIQFADFKNATLDRVDGYLFAENDFYSDHDAMSASLTLNGMMAAGDLVRFNQEYINNQWRALPDSYRTQFLITFDTRIREFMRDQDWLPGLPGGTNRVMPAIPKQFNVILSWTER